MHPPNPLPHAFLLACTMLWAAPLSAQQESQQKEHAAQDAAAMMEAGQPGEPHRHLARLVGTWDAEVKFWMDPSAEPMISHGTIEYEMVMGGRYLEEKITSDFMGQPFKGLGIYGYNNVTGELQAIWLDDMSTGIYTYTGSMNEAGDQMVLKGKHIDPATREWIVSRGEIHVISEDQIRYVSYEVRDDQETKVMEITGTRKGNKQAMDDRTDGGGN